MNMNRNFTQNKHFKKCELVRSTERRESINKQVQWNDTVCSEVVVSDNKNEKNTKIEAINKEICQQMTFLLDNFNVHSDWKEIKRHEKPQYRPRNYSTNIIPHPPHISQNKEKNLVSPVDVSKKVEGIFDLTQFTKKKYSKDIVLNEINAPEDNELVSSGFSRSSCLDKTSSLKVDQASLDKKEIYEDYFFYSEKERNAERVDEYSDLVLINRVAEEKEEERIISKSQQKRESNHVYGINEMEKNTTLEKSNIKIKQKHKIGKEDFHKFEKEKEELKTKFESKLKEIVTNYEEEKERSEKHIKEIHVKYKNLQNKLLKLEKEKTRVEDQNEKLLEELRVHVSDNLNAVAIQDYKEKLQQYIDLSQEQEESLQEIKKKLRMVTKALDEKEKDHLNLKEENRKLNEMNNTLKKDKLDLQDYIEKLKSTQESMKEIILNKEMKIQYFINILNVIDERILNEPMKSSSMLKQKQTNAKIEVNAIHNMNKKIIIKSIIHKIKELNRKIESCEKVLLHNSIATTEPKIDSYADKKICTDNYSKLTQNHITSKDMLENCFDFQHLELHESENKLREEENESRRNFFIKVQENNDNS